MDDIEKQLHDSNQRGIALFFKSSENIAVTLEAELSHLDRLMPFLDDAEGDELGAWADGLPTLESCRRRALVMISGIDRMTKKIKERINHGKK